MHGIYRETGRAHNYRLIAGVWKAGVAVATGDLIFRDADGYDKPVTNYTWNTNIATTSAALNALFRGVSMVRRLTTQTTDGGRSDGMILADGPFEFPCTALGSAAKPGDLVSFETTGSNAVENQKVRVTATLGEAIGRVLEDAPVGSTFLTFELDPALYKGGPQAIQ
jgi:hypothetical protein